MHNRLFYFLPAAFLFSACASILPKAEKIQKPPYTSLSISHHPTLGLFLIITPSFKIITPEITREQLLFLETRIADLDRMKLYRDNDYGIDITLPTNDKKYVDEQLSLHGKATKVIPETLTVSAKFTGGRNPKIILKTNPDILDTDGTLRFSVKELKKPETDNSAAAAAEKTTVKPVVTVPKPVIIPAEKKAADTQAHLQKKHGKTVKLKRSGTVLSASGNPVIIIDADLTISLETARITFTGTVKNLGQQKIWATYYLPQFTYRKGKDWYTFSTRQFSDTLTDENIKPYLIPSGTEKTFQFTTDPELQVLVYDPIRKKVTPRNAFTSKEENDLLKFEILEKYLSGNPAVQLEVFPDQRICADCGVKLF